MKPVSFMIVVLCLLAGTAQAQIIQSVNRFTTPGDAESKAGAAVADGEKSKGAKALTQGDVNASADGTKVGIQAADLWLSRFFRFYGRLTLPVTEQQESQGAGDKANAVTETPAPPAVTAAARQQLMDPFGGLLNLSGGLFMRLGKQAQTKVQVSQVKDRKEIYRTLGRLKVDADTEESTQKQISQPQLMVAAGVERLKAEGRNQAQTLRNDEAAKQLQDPHGLFLDWRVGLKFINLPEPGASNPDISGNKANVFYATALGLKYIAPLYDERPTGNAGADDLHRTGGLTLGGYIVLNYAADRTQSSVFKTGALESSTWAATGVLGWDLPNTDVAALTFSFSPWTNNAQLGKTFVFGLTLKRKTEDKPDTEAKAAPASGQKK
jgi:hypothetical protein